MDSTLDELFTRSISQYSSTQLPPSPPPPLPIINPLGSVQSKNPSESDSALPPLSANPPKTTIETREKTLRTVFVGNVPAKVATDKNKLREFKRLFAHFGKLDSIRFRSVAFARPLKDTKTRKFAFIHGELHSQRDSLNAYIVFTEETSVLSAVRELNSFEFEGHHLRVDRCAVDNAEKKRYDTKRCVFIGNLPFNASEEQLWGLFTQCGQVESVRLIRDKVTGVGKGFGYLQFKERSSVPLALELDGSIECHGRKLRVQKCNNIKGSTNTTTTTTTTTTISKSFQGDRVALSGARLRLKRKAAKAGSR